MTTYDLYGTRTMTTEVLARFLQALLAIPFEPRRSGFIGDYYRASLGDERFSVEPNSDDNRDEEELLEPEFADRQTLLYIDRTDRAEELGQVLSSIAGLELVRRS